MRDEDRNEYSFHVSIGNRGFERVVTGGVRAGRLFDHYTRRIEKTAAPLGIGRGKRRMRFAPGFIRIETRYGKIGSWKPVLTTTYDGSRWHTQHFGGSQ